MYLVYVNTAKHIFKQLRGNSITAVNTFLKC